MSKRIIINDQRFTITQGSTGRQKDLSCPAQKEHQKASTDYINCTSNILLIWLLDTENRIYFALQLRLWLMTFPS